jgi:hypothetical protein
LITGLVTAGVIAFVGLRLAQGARYSVGREGRRRVEEIVRGIRFRHVWPVPIVLTLVVAGAVLILPIPGMAWGWWTALGGEGNPVFGSNDQTEGTPLEWLLPIVFIVLLVPALPLFALREEQMFRRGAEHWSWIRRVLMALAFGLVHAIVGIPIGFALALSIGGGYFQLAYLRQFRRTGIQRDAVLESTRAHTAYNGLIVVAVLVVLVLSLALG